MQISDTRSFSYNSYCLFLLFVLLVSDFVECEYKIVIHAIVFRFFVCLRKIRVTSSEKSFEPQSRRCCNFSVKRSNKNIRYLALNKVVFFYLCRFSLIFCSKSQWTFAIVNLDLLFSLFFSPSFIFTSLFHCISHSLRTFFAINSSSSAVISRCVSSTLILPFWGNHWTARKICFGVDEC